MIGKGLLKKLIFADYIAVHFIDKVLDAPDAYPGFVALIAMFAYSLQIYADFSVYTDMAIGVSKLMGFNLLENLIHHTKRFLLQIFGAAGTNH